MKKVELLRKKYPRFFYKRYSFEWKGENLFIAFDFAVPPDIAFKPKVVIKNAPRKEEGIVKNLVFHLGLIELLSYWKATCSPEIVVEAGSLKKAQINWWKNLILKGMGEFFFQNTIDFTKPNFLKIKTVGKSHDRGFFLQKLKERMLVLIGGGKDAIVTLELLKNLPHRTFVLNPKQEQRAILKIAGEKNPIVVERTIDPKLLRLNRRGFLNGHTPFSAYLAFLTVLVAALFDYRYIALSNERSSNEGNVEYLGKVINHQYSKSFEFEKKFREYSKKYLAKNAEYFSFLRPLYELQIAKIFARFPKYFGTFLSCNEAHKTKSGAKKATGKWCKKCAKCLFAFIALAPFVGEKRVAQIFGKNLLRDKTLKPLLGQLTGKEKFKPFECVGTIEESKAALALCLQKKKSYKLLRSWNTKHFLPPAFSRILDKALGAR